MASCIKCEQHPRVFNRTVCQGCLADAHRERRAKKKALMPPKEPVKASKLKADFRHSSENYEAIMAGGAFDFSLSKTYMSRSLI